MAQNPDYNGFFNSIGACFITKNIYDNASRPKILPCKCGIHVERGLDPLNDQYNEDHNIECTHEHALQRYQRYNIGVNTIPFITWQKILHYELIPINTSINNLTNFQQLTNVLNNVNVDELFRFLSRWLQFGAQIFNCLECKDNEGPSNINQITIVVLTCGYHICVNCLDDRIRQKKRGRIVDCTCEGQHNINDLKLCRKKQISHFTRTSSIHYHIFDPSVQNIQNNLVNPGLFTD